MLQCSRFTFLALSCSDDHVDVAPVCVHVEEEIRDYQEQLKQMLKDLAQEKNVEKPLPLMNQVHTAHSERIQTP